MYPYKRVFFQWGYIVCYNYIHEKFYVVKSLSLSNNKLGGHRVLELKNIVKKYNTGGSEVEVLKSVNIHFRENEFVSILGASGSGKTTLLNIIGGLDKYTSGDMALMGRSTKEFKDRDWDSYRKE